MAAPDRQAKPDIYRSEQNVQNWSFDELYKVLVTIPVLEYNNELFRLQGDVSGSLKVAITSGGGGGTQYADGAARGTATGTVAMVDDGTNIQSLSGDSTGKLNVNNISGTVSLPTGAATSAKQDTLLTELQLKADLTETQPVSLASVPSHAVTNAGTFAVQNTAATPTGTNSIGQVGTSANAINVGQKTVSTTAVQISATATVPTNGILVQALAGNAAVLYVGGSGVTTSTGWELSPGQAIAFTCTLNTLYIISVASTTDKICFQVV